MAPYPVTPTETAREIRFGQSFADAFRWMENLDDPRLYPWVRAQNTYTARHLSGPTFDAIYGELKTLYGEAKDYDATQFDEFLVEGHNKRKPLRSRTMRSPAGGLEVGTSGSPSGKYETRFESMTKGDFGVMTIKDTTTSTFLSDVLLVKFATVVWDNDDSSFLYVNDRDGRMQDTFPVIRRHKVGTSQPADKVLFEAADPMSWLSIFRLPQGVLVMATSLSQTSWGWLDATKGGVEWKGQLPVDVSPFDFVNNQLYFIAFDATAPMGAVRALDVTTGTVANVYQSPDFAMEGAAIEGDRLVITVVDQASSRLFVVDLTSGQRNEVALPGIGAATLSAGESISINFVTYTSNSSSWKLDVATRGLILEQEAAPAPLELEAKRISYTTATGVEAPLWLIYKKGTQLTADTPTYLYGYGGFSINLMPRYIKSAVPWFNRGGVYAIATLPGGKEMGQPWHDSGRLFQKQNVFKSFGAAAQRLIDLGLTRKEKLAIGGGSNGGLLVGATMNLYPDLFQAAVPEVGVMDMTRFELFTGGKWWVDEYGTREDYRSYLNLVESSPYHNLVRRTYPHTLVITGDGDDRVVPSHSYKYAAKLQQVQSHERAALLHVRRGGSHGSAGTMSETLRGITMRWTFLSKELGI